MNNLQIFNENNQLVWLVSARLLLYSISKRSLILFYGFRLFSFFFFLFDLSNGTDFNNINLRFILSDFG